MGEEEQSLEKEESPRTVALDGPEKEENSAQKLSSLKGIIISAGFTFLGVVIGVLGKGGFDVVLEEKRFLADQQLERQKLDADLVKLAIQASGKNGAETLGFMVDTNLIMDPEIRKGVKAYLESQKPVPTLSPSRPLEDELLLNPSVSKKS